MSNLTELLLEYVYTYPILYDLSHKDYKNLKKKDRIRDDIGEELKMPGDDLKKWKNLRDTYAKYLSNKTSTGQEKKNYKKWQWASHMERFSRFLIMAKTETNITPLSEDNSNVVIDSTNDFNVVGNDHNEIGGELQNLNDSNTAPEEDNNVNNAKRVKRMASVSNVDKVVQYLQNKQKTEYDAIDHFMLGFAKTIKQFSPKRQAETKMQISRLIFEKELEQIEENDFNSPSTSTVSPWPNDSPDNEESTSIRVYNSFNTFNNQ